MQADLGEIYNQLFAGNKVQLHFNSAKEAEYFRIRLAQYKTKQETNLLSLGFLDASAVMALSFKYDKVSGNGIVAFVPKRAAPVFNIVVIADDSSKS